MINLSMRWFLNVAASLLGFSLLFDHGVGGARLPLQVEVVNDLTPKFSLELYWISESGPELVSKGLTTSLSLNTYVSHSFLAAPEDVDVKSISSYIDNPNVTMFTIEEYDDCVTILKRENETLTAMKENYATVARKMLRESISACINKEQGISEGATCSSVVNQPFTLNPDVLDCVSGNKNLLGLSLSQFYSPPVYNSFIASKEAKHASQLRSINKLLDGVGDHLRNYTCADPEGKTPSMDDPRTLRVMKWRDYDVQVFLDDEDARVMVLHDFISEDQCNILVSKSMDKLKPATVTPVGRNGGILSNARRAAVHHLIPDLSDENDLIAMLYKKAYDFANDETGYNLTVDSNVQEGFNVISYEYGDEYLSHCDGACSGKNYKPGGRVSTMVFYCSEAEEGGGTTFSNIDLLLKGKRGQATFFSYLGPDMTMDMGKTRHSGCPVLKGRKWIATLWMRKGVSEGNEWYHYDPSGNRVT